MPRHSHEKHVITAADAPAAIGPYSHAVSVGHFVFVSGQLGLDPVSGTLVEGGIQAQTRQALSNLRSVLQAAGTSPDQVVKTTVFLTDMNLFAQMNTVYAEFFPANCPARSAVQVAALPKGGLVEVEAIALISPLNSEEPAAN